MALVVTCPACQKRLQVPEELIGQNVQCPECRGTFTAQGDTPTVAVTGTPSKAPLPSAPAKPAWETPPEEEKRPTRRRSRAYDEDDKDFDEDFNEDFDDDNDFDDRPRRRRRSRRSGLSRNYLAPHRGGMILAFGIIALVGSFAFIFLGIIFGPMAWIMGSNDLREMRMGRMDPSGEGMTQTGRILGIITTCLFLVGIVGCCIFIGIDAGRPRRF